MDKEFKKNKPRIRFLTDGFGNDKGETVGITLSTELELYYYDGFRRWCYLEKSLEGKDFEYVGNARNRV